MGVGELRCHIQFSHYVVTHFDFNPSNGVSVHWNVFFRTNRKPGLVRIDHFCAINRNFSNLFLAKSFQERAYKVLALF